MNNKNYKVTSTSIVETRYLGIPKEYKLKCIEELSKLCNKDYKFTNVNALRTEGYLLWENSKVFDKLLENITVHYHQYISSIELNQTLFKNNTIKNAWGVIYKEGGYSKKHNHNSFFYSFIYCLSAESNNSPLIFEDKTYIQPKDDMLMLFPSHLYHEVLPNKGTKFVIAGNIT